MKTTKESIEKLYDEFNEKEETLLIVYVDKNQGLSTYACGDMASVAASVASVIDQALDKENGVSENGRFVGKAIANGVCEVLSYPSSAGRALAAKATLALAEAVANARKGIFSVSDKVDREDCEHCDNNRWCPLPDAVDWRKQHKNPRKNRKPRRRPNNNDEKGS